MDTTILAAIIGVLGAISVPFIAKYINNREKGENNPQTVKEVMILSPKDGSEITMTPKEEKPIERQITGKVNGFTKDELFTLGLKVGIRIKTDQWYEQKTLTGEDVSVGHDGYWEFPKARFGDKFHLVEANLRDKYGRTYNSATINVTVRQ